MLGVTLSIVWYISLVLYPIKTVKIVDATRIEKEG